MLNLNKNTGSVCACVCVRVRTAGWSVHPVWSPSVCADVRAQRSSEGRGICCQEEYLVWFIATPQSVGQRGREQEQHLGEREEQNPQLQAAWQRRARTRLSPKKQRGEGERLLEFRGDSDRRRKRRASGAAISCAWWCFWSGPNTSVFLKKAGKMKETLTKDERIGKEVWMFRFLSKMFK